MCWGCTVLFSICRESQDREECLLWAQAAPHGCDIHGSGAVGTESAPPLPSGSASAGDSADGAPGDPARLSVGYVNDRRLFFFLNKSYFNQRVQMNPLQNVLQLVK